VQPKRFTGGLAIISRFPFLETNVHTYTQSSSPEKYGFLADGYATKGVLHARIALTDAKSPHEAVDVFVTHMEAREDALRPSQYAEFAEFVGRHASPERPALMLGDFNTRGDAAEMQNADSPYNLMLSKYRAAQPEMKLVDLWAAIGQGKGGTSDQERDDGGRRIDYIFVLNPLRSAAVLEPKLVEVNRFLDPQVTALSDHSAVQAVLKWTPPAR
jgi:endonuclease/exonuclease/phosphatase family metal-dependent hydrolase